MSLRLLFLFVVVPIVELALLIEIGRGIGFWPTMGASIVVTIASFAAFALIVRRFGIELL